MQTYLTKLSIVTYRGRVHSSASVTTNLVHPCSLKSSIASSVWCAGIKMVPHVPVCVRADDATIVPRAMIIRISMVLII